MSNAASSPEFKKILQDLYDSGKYRTSGEVLREAWKIYRHQYGTTQQRRYAMRKTAMGMNPRINFTKMQLQKLFEFLPGTVRQRINAVEKAFDIYDVKVSGKRGQRLQIFSWKLNETRKNPRSGNLITDMKWLRDVHLPQLPRKYKSAIIYGNEDWPEKIEVYLKKSPTVNDVPLTFLPNESGKFYLSNPRRKKTRKYGMAMKKPRKNPIAVYNPKARLTKLPASQIEMRYKRTNGRYRGKWFKHNFKSSVTLFGMPDGNILLKSAGGKQLWGTAS